MFKLYLQAYRLDKGLDAPPVAAPTIETWRAAAKACDAAAAPTVAPTPAAAVAKAPRRSRTPVAKAARAIAPATPATMAELLRSYGHVPEVVA